MERELETMFDTVTGLQASLLDTHQLKDMCREQQAITMRRIANWLRMNARIYHKDYETSIAKQVGGLADEIEYLAEVATSEIFSSKGR